MSVWNVIIGDLRAKRHLDAYMAIVLGLGIFVLTVLGKASIDVVTAGVLLVTSFCVWESLGNRHDLASLRELIGKGGTSNILRLGFHPDPQAVGQHLRSARQIDLCGVSLFRLIPLTYPHIAEAVSNGAKLRVIVSDPNSAAVEMASLRSPDGVTPADERQRIIATLASLVRLMNHHPNRDIEVRICPLLFPCSIVSIVPADRTKTPYCHAAVLPFRSPALESPMFVPDPNREREWYEYLVSQFKSIWDASLPFQPEDDLNPIGNGSPRR